MLNSTNQVSSFEIVAPAQTRRVGTVSGLHTIRPAEGEEPGLVRYDVEAAGPVVIEFWWPASEAVTVWQPVHTSARDLPPDWGSRSRRTVRSAKSAPVAALVDARDRSPLVVGLSSNVRGCDFALGVDEENGEYHIRIAVSDVESSTEVPCFTLRIDLRELHFAEALRAATADWADELGDKILPVPGLARQAMYSTWYSDHQQVSAETVEHPALTRVPYGCRAIIVDGGWQNSDLNGEYDNLVDGYYASCGDWEPDTDRFPDMTGHVQRVHDLGLQYVLWVAPPFVGDRSSVWGRFKNKTLGRSEGDRFAVLDPRYPEVREHIVEACIRPVRDWNVDGLKIDFIDQWARSADPAGLGTDCETVDEGVEKVLQAITDLMRQLRDEVLIEFRQDYVHPRLWQFGTFVRANDCPMDAIENRVRTIDARLLAGDRAVHSDMMMWHRDAPAEVVASHFINTLFAAPQVSIDFDTASAEQKRAVGFWLKFFRDHADVLLGGRLTPSRPDARYTQVRAENEYEKVVAVYTDPVVHLQGVDRPVIVVNGSGQSRVLIEGAGPDPVNLVLYDCTGTEIRHDTMVRPDVWPINVPPSGLVRIERA
ncbi:glycoside hydrolase family 36 protein [Arthrobacter bambusae]|uniref:Alpha-galactosidase n=1 Tax=Arthrobacter bambusae TaxID=1338426 RepID=A0AAW8DI88_9MICC|nr:glycoside hydrolase family 36 protein [Arthrobacter bambusae]MDP9905522.1 alpha-galactosidase [Arthrobacter bambusae]MDQ0127396.1 alpha-galactosidase [Arthrobacter bambusae]MDQ0178738.1 alpha-galactosidase [Arthrobacter bambusae]